jgi:hypothetical protein
MIRIEGIPILAARLEAASKSAGVSETSAPGPSAKDAPVVQSKTAHLAGRGRMRGRQHKEGV